MARSLARRLTFLYFFNICFSFPGFLLQEYRRQKKTVVASLLHKNIAISIKSFLRLLLLRTLSVFPQTQSFKTFSFLVCDKPVESCLKSSLGKHCVLNYLCSAVGVCTDTEYCHMYCTDRSTPSILYFVNVYLKKKVTDS